MKQDYTTAAGCLAGLIGSRLLGTPLPPALKDALTPERVKEIYLLSKEQDLSHLAGAALSEAGVLTGEGVLTEKAAGAFARQEYLAYYRYERITYELDALRRVLTEEEIRFLPLKGSVLRDYYPDPVMRTSCDIDVLVRPEERAKAAAALVGKLGYRREGESTHDISLFTPSDLHVELHFDLIDDNEIRSRGLGDPWENASPKEEGSFEYTLNGAYFYAYMMAHTAKHFCNGGCGIRPFMDLVVIERSMPYDKEALAALLEAQDLTVFHRCAQKLASYWFLGGEGDEMTAKMEAYVLQGGSYGSLTAAVTARVGKRGKFRFLLSKIFPSFSRLRQQYPILEKAPILYPFCQVARWFTILFLPKRRKIALQQVKTAQNCAEEETALLTGLYRDLHLS